MVFLHVIKESSDLNYPRLFTIEERKKPLGPHIREDFSLAWLESHDSGWGQSRIMCLISLVRVRGVSQRKGVRGIITGRQAEAFTWWKT